MCQVTSCDSSLISWIAGGLAGHSESSLLLSAAKAVLQKQQNQNTKRKPEKALKILQESTTLERWSSLGTRPLDCCRSVRTLPFSDAR